MDIKLKTVKNLPLKILLWLAIAVQLVCTAVLGIKLVKMSILPASYMVVFLLVIVAFNIVTFFSAKKTGLGIAMLILSLILTAVLIYATAAIHKVDETIQNVSNNPGETVTEMVIVVRKDSQVENITDLKQFAVGYVQDSDYDACKTVLDEIQSKTGNVRLAEFEDKFDMVDALYAKTVNALVINKAYIEMVSEVSGYESFSEDIKIIYASDVKSYINVVPEHETNLDAFIVYFSGIDTFGWVGARSRSDVNILAVVNTKTKHIQLINTPRDYYVTFPVSKGVKDKLTHAGLYGIDNSIGTLNALYGIKIDFYVRMNFSGFENIIDALGGIDVYSEYDFTVEPIKHYTVGMNHLTGIEALAFARERYAFAAGDYQRGRNQMAVIKAMIGKITSADMLYNYTDVLDSIADSFQTNMTPEDIYSLVRMQLADMSDWTIEDYTVTGNGKSSSETYSMPGQTINVIEPDYATVETAKTKIQQIMQER